MMRLLLFTMVYCAVSVPAQDTFTGRPAGSPSEGSVGRAGQQSAKVAGRHKVMVIIPEYHISHPRPGPVRRPIPDPAGETEVLKCFLAKSFDVVDQGQVATIRQNDQIRAALQGDTGLAAKIGLEHGADIVVIGEAFSEFAGQAPGGLLSCRARVEGRAIKTDTGQVLCADGKHASGLDIAEAIAGKRALEKAGAELGEVLSTQVLAKLQTAATGFGRIEVIIDGLKYADFLSFKKALLQSTKEIGEIHQTSFTEQRVVTQMEYHGNAQGLAERFVTAPVKGFTVELKEMSGSRLSIEAGVVPGGSAPVR